MIDCLNLEEQFPAYRIRMSADHEPGQRRDPWNFEIPCAKWKGCIYPHGGTMLQAYVHTRFLNTAIKALESAGAKPWQIGDTEGTFLFDVSAFEKVAAVLKPKRKRLPNSRSFGAGSRQTGTIEGQTGGEK